MYYPKWLVWNCPQHVEAKTLANKYWHQMDTILQKQEQAIQDENVSKLLALCAKFDKIEHEFQCLQRGINKCRCY